MEIDSWSCRRRRLGACGPELSPIGLSARGATSVAAAVALAKGINWIHFAAGTTPHPLPDIAKMLAVIEVEASPTTLGGAIGRAIASSMAALGRPMIDVLLLRPTPGSDVLQTWTGVGTAADLGAARAIGLAGVTDGDLERCHQTRPVDAVLLDPSEPSARARAIRLCRWSGIGVLEEADTPADAAESIKSDGVTGVILPARHVGVSSKVCEEHSWMR